MQIWQQDQGLSQFFFWLTQACKQYFLLCSVFQTKDDKTPVFIFLFMQNSFISRKLFCSAQVTSAFRMCLCATQMNTSLSQLRKIKIISSTGEKDDTILNNCSIFLLWFAAKSVSFTCTYLLAGLQAICYQLLISQVFVWTPASNEERYLTVWEQSIHRSTTVQTSCLPLLRRAHICALLVTLLTRPEILIYLSTTLQFRASLGISTSVVF